MGFAGAALGDVNGDGIDDFAVGVARDKVAIIFGSSTPLGSLVGSQQVLDFATITPTQGFLIEGASIVASAGDINGDGLQEIALGRPTGVPNNQGDGYVIFGKQGAFGQVANGQAVISLATLSPSDGFLVRGKEGGDASATDISAAGDLNGDGIGDLLVGSPYADPVGAQFNSGNAYIVFGHTGTSFGALVGGRTIVFLGGLNPGEGVLISGDGAGAYAGTSVAPLGDFNGDGIDDIVIGAPGQTTLYTIGGAAYVVFGTRGSFGPTVAGQTTLYTGTLSPSQGFLMAGDFASGLGQVVRAAGDLNADGLPDLVVVSHTPDSYGASAFVVFGSRNLLGEEIAGRRVLNMVTLPPSVGFAFKGAVRRLSAARAGDFNGDGIDDLLLGDQGRDAVATGSGVGYVIYGSRQPFGVVVNGRGVIDLETVPKAAGTIFRGVAAQDGAGYAVAGLGDVNDDGRLDMMIGAPTTPLFGSGRAGIAYVMYGLAQ
ncbi:FG-GAP-like repeat-containing protein [Altererythrobacter sp. Root672]|uniref:FG-GAP-like repeat-containing protein n=1 Tax=Altererythrobacter sp. Root672 TaxID=1736584 RepID=UPI000702220A|nr:FG-GAP-like repeat-containing protein [Altererythrobacter sp. Root672]KRA83728.1 hypothetical protein ASD76_06830 [Altererythrobacter sp. Root672]